MKCPFCLNSDRARLSSFGTSDGLYRVYGCDACHRYLKAFDARRANRPLMPVVDGVAMLPPASRKEDVKVLEDNATKLAAALG